jgi:hypothetical protein
VEVDVDTDADVEAGALGGSQSTAKKRGRSANWLPCEVVAAFLARQYASRETGSQSKLSVRQVQSAKAYPAIIETLDQNGYCTWTEGVDARGGHLVANATESIKKRTSDEAAKNRILAKGDELRKALSAYTQAFGRHYPIVSKNNYSPRTGDNDGSATWSETEFCCRKEAFSNVIEHSVLHTIRSNIDACELAFRIVCGSSPHGPPPHSSLHTYVDAVYALDPAARLDQENAPTERELKAHEMKRRKVAALDPGCNAAITSPSKREAEFHAKVDGFMNKILDIAQAPVHFAASAEKSERVAERERAMDDREQRLGAMEQQLADKLAKVDALLAKMEEPSTGQLEPTAAKEKVAEQKDAEETRIVGLSPPHSIEPPHSYKLWSSKPEESTCRRSSRTSKRRVWD